MARPRALTEADAAYAVASYTDGWSAASIAEELGVSVSTILNEVRRAGATVRPRGRVPASA